MTLMTINKFLKRVAYNLFGTEDDAPTIGGDDANYWIDVLNRKKDEMYDDATKKWESAFAVKTIGTITASNNLIFNLDDTDTNNKLSGFIGEARKPYVISSQGQRSEFTIIKADEVSSYKQQVHIYGFNPQKLRFTKPILAGDQLVNGTLYMPAYWRPADIDPEGDGDTQYVPVDDPNWGAMAVAAEVAFNDITYEEKYDDLQAKADVLWRNMVKKNRRRVRGNPRTTPIAVTKIPGVR